MNKGGKGREKVRVESCPRVEIIGNVAEDQLVDDEVGDGRIPGAPVVFPSQLRYVFGRR